jgi:hypothetical protein
MIYAAASSTALSSNCSTTKLRISTDYCLSLHAHSPLTNRCVPAASAHLDGAQQITLQGVKHSMDSATAEWYGSESVIDG